MSLNQQMAKFRQIQEQVAKLAGVKEGLLAVYQTGGTIYAALDALEVARLNGAITPEGFTSMREGIDAALKALDAAVAVVAQNFRRAEKVAVDTADDINAIQLGMQRQAGLAKALGNPSDGN